MKIQRLRRNIIINITASLALLILALGIVFYTTNKKDLNTQKVNKIHLEAVNIKRQAQELESQTNDARKYKEVWKTIVGNKKNTQGIKMDEVNNSLTTIAAKYSIYTPSLQVVVPENLESGIFQRKTISISHSNGTLSFDALSDVKAMAFINEFFGTLPGYIVINSFDMNKIHKYLPEDFVNISLGKNPGILKAKVTFSWYALHEKVRQENPPR